MTTGQPLSVAETSPPSTQKIHDAFHIYKFIVVKNANIFYAVWHIGIRSSEMHKVDGSSSSHYQDQTLRGTTEFLNSLVSADPKTNALIEEAKKADQYLDPLVSVAKKLLQAQEKEPLIKPAFRELKPPTDSILRNLSACVLARLGNTISTEICLLTSTPESVFSESNDDFAKQAKDTITKIKRAILVYFKLAEKTYNPGYQSPSKIESRWDSDIASIEQRLQKGRTILDRLRARFTHNPIKITVGSAGARTGPMPHYQTVYVCGTTSKQFFMG